MKFAPKTLSLALLLAAAGSAQAAGQHLNAIGLDMARLVDVSQFEPQDGTLNLFYQGYLTKNAGWTFAYAWGDDSEVWEASYKIYNQLYQSGSFWQMGLAVVDVDNSPFYSHDPALWGAFGYERKPVENIVVNAAVKAYVGVEHPYTGDKELILFPSLSVAFTF
jgi:hypothetical protein